DERTSGNDEGVGAARPWSSPRAAPAWHDRSGARAATRGTAIFLFHFLCAVCARSLTRLCENSFPGAPPLRDPSPCAHGLAVPGASFVGGRGQHAARLRALLRALARPVRPSAPVIHERHERFLCT